MQPEMTSQNHLASQLPTNPAVKDEATTLPLPCEK